LDDPMKTSLLLDPKVLQVDVLGLLAENAAIGFAADDVSGLLAGRE
jgi:hypothetical protein